MNCLTGRFKNLKTVKMFYGTLLVWGHLCIQSLTSDVKQQEPRSLTKINKYLSAMFV